MRLEGILGGLHALLSLEPDETELVLDVVDHDLGTVATFFIITTLGGRVGALELEVLGSFEVFAAVGGPEDGAVFDDLEGVGDDLVAGDDVLTKSISWIFLELESLYRGGDNGEKKNKKEEPRFGPKYIKESTHLVDNHFEEAKRYCCFLANRGKVKAAGVLTRNRVL